jgi:hypothetical protein
MKTTEIQVGKTYSNRKNRHRLVTGDGPQFAWMPYQGDLDCVEYAELVMHGLTTAPPSAVRHNCTRSAFAKWAKEEVRDE